MNEPVPPPPPPKAKLTRAAARNCALINQLGTPGLGSLMARRWLVGTGQLLLFLTSFVLLIAWFVIVIRNQLEDQGLFNGPMWMLEVGAAAFVGSWLWALVTSLGLLRQARTNA
jgi:hypothetical protein